MDQSQYSINQLLQNKRDLLRETIRKNDLMKILEEKRIQIQQNQESQEPSTITSESSFDQKISKSKIETESQSEEDCLTRLTKIRTKVNLTPNYLAQLLEYLKKNPYIYQVLRIFTLCEDAILDQKQNSDLVHHLTEIIFTLTKYKKEIPFEPIPLLLQAFAIHQDYVILQYIKMYVEKNNQEIVEIDKYCQKQCTSEKDNFLYIINNNLKYANLQMLLFLCETISNKQFFEAIKFYGQNILDIKKTQQKEYRKIIEKIQQLIDMNQKAIEINDDEWFDLKN